MKSVLQAMNVSVYLIRAVRYLNYLFIIEFEDKKIQKINENLLPIQSSLLTTTMSNFYSVDMFCTLSNKQ